MLTIKEIKMDALRQALMGYSNNELDGMNIYTISGDTLADYRKNIPLQFGVNWAGCGTQDVQTTRAFVERLNRAIELVEMLNSLELGSRPEDDDREYTHDQYITEVEKVINLLKLGDADFLKLWFEKEVQ